jgi:hypothetical protein
LIAVYPSFRFVLVAADRVTHIQPFSHHQRCVCTPDSKVQCRLNHVNPCWSAEAVGSITICMSGAAGNDTSKTSYEEFNKIRCLAGKGEYHVEKPETSDSECGVVNCRIHHPHSQHICLCTHRDLLDSDVDRIELFEWYLGGWSVCSRLFLGVSLVAYCMRELMPGQQADIMIVRGELLQEMSPWVDCYCTCMHVGRP